MEVVVRTHGLGSPGSQAVGASSAPLCWTNESSRTDVQRDAYCSGFFSNVALHAGLQK